MRNDTTKMIHKGEVIKYVLLPQVLPRVLNLFRRFSTSLALYIAILFSALRILPSSHVYLKPENIGKYGFVAILYAGGQNIVWDRKHIDKIIIYLMVILGMAAFCIQIISMIGILMTPQAFAAPQLIEKTDDWTYFFEPKDPAQDYALRFLDLVFGLSDNSEGNPGLFFQSCLGGSEVCKSYEGQDLDPYPYTNIPLPIHHGLHSILEFYNYTIIGIGFFIAFYYVVTLTAETAASGMFLGRRANKLWIPIRVIFFAALIMPFFHGLNLGQILVLNAGYYGSGLASNSWKHFLQVVGDEQAGKLDQLIAEPTEYPSSIPMFKYMMLAKTCKYVEQRLNKRIIDAYIVRQSLTGEENCMDFSHSDHFGGITDMTDETNTVMGFTRQQDIRIRFGERARAMGTHETLSCGSDTSTMQDKYRNHIGNVIPYCGELVIDISGIHNAHQRNFAWNNYDMLHWQWNSTDIDGWAKLVADIILDGSTDVLPEEEIRAAMFLEEALQVSIIRDIIALMRTGDMMRIPEELGDCGWMCAAIYYNRIAEANGDIASFIFKMPNVELWPAVMEVTRTQLGQDGTDVPFMETFNAILGGGRVIETLNQNDLKVAEALNYVLQEVWDNEIRMSNDQSLPLATIGLADIISIYNDGGGASTLAAVGDVFRPTMSAQTNNPIMDFVISIFGINGLFDMRANSDIHPLAQLSMLGKGMVEATIRSFGFAVGGTILALGLEMEESLSGVSELVKGPIVSMLTTFGMITLTVGFILYYILPFLPFLYFFFAASAWITAIFEAMIGIPLWALAHLRVDGDGIIGQGASGGWSLLLDILLRPILILIGLIASISIFSALVKVLNEIFLIVAANAGGFNVLDAFLESEGTFPAGYENTQPFSMELLRSPIDMLFYSIIYAIIVYMIGMASFKLVDLIPNYILRWMNAAVKTFGEFAGDPSAELMQKVGRGLTLAAITGSGILGQINRNGNSLANDPEAD